MKVLKVKIGEIRLVGVESRSEAGRIPGVDYVVSVNGESYRMCAKLAAKLVKLAGFRKAKKGLAYWRRHGGALKSNRPVYLAVDRGRVFRVASLDYVLVRHGRLLSLIEEVVKKYPVTLLYKRHTRTECGAPAVEAFWGAPVGGELAGGGRLYWGLYVYTASDGSTGIRTWGMLACIRGEGDFTPLFAKRRSATHVEEKSIEERIAKYADEVLTSKEYEPILEKIEKMAEAPFDRSKVPAKLRHLYARAVALFGETVLAWYYLLTQKYPAVATKLIEKYPEWVEESVEEVKKRIARRQPQKEPSDGFSGGRSEGAGGV